MNILNLRLSGSPAIGTGAAVSMCGSRAPICARRGYYYSEPVWVQRGERWERRGGNWARGDRDRDGIPNRMDRDRDGDGVPNRYDRAPNNPNRR